MDSECRWFLTLHNTGLRVLRITIAVRAGAASGGEERPVIARVPTLTCKCPAFLFSRRRDSSVPHSRHALLRFLKAHPSSVHDENKWALHGGTLQQTVESSVQDVLGTHQIP